MKNILDIVKDYFYELPIPATITSAFGLMGGLVVGGVVAVNVFKDPFAAQYAIPVGGLSGLIAGGGLVPIGIEIIHQLFPKAQTTDESTAIARTISPATQAAPVEKKHPTYGSIFSTTPNQENQQPATQPVDQDIKRLDVPRPSLTNQVE